MAEAHGDQEFVSDLGVVKDAIGDWHDWEELVAIGKKVLQHRNCKLIAQLKSTADERFNQALDLTEKMRKHYLCTQKQAGRRNNRAKPAQEVWSATAALAA